MVGKGVWNMTALLIGIAIAGYVILSGIFIRLGLILKELEDRDGKKDI